MPDATASPTLAPGIDGCAPPAAAAAPWTPPADAAAGNVHRENFHVLSWLLPRRLRPAFVAVYAWCRFADDLADEAPDRDAALSALRWWRGELHATFAGRPTHPISVALEPVITTHRLKREPFDDLLDAFEQDQRVSRYRTLDEVIDYCRGSANPVGRLVLRLADADDAESCALSDATCTALQLANHWQDVRRDVLERDRVYIPTDVAARHGLSIASLVQAIRLDAQHSDPGCPACVAGGVGLRALRPVLSATLRDLCDTTAAMFARGRGLWPRLPDEVRKPVMLFTLGGEAVLRQIAAREFDTSTHRPRVSKPARVGLLLRAWLNAPPAAVRFTHAPVRGGPR